MDAREAHAAPSPPGGAAAGAALERFCVALCHDLRGPVATAGAAVHRLAHALDPPSDELPMLVEIARRSLEKADQLLGSLPELLAREGEALLTTVDLEPLVETVRGDVEIELRLAGARFEVRGRLPVVLGEPERLRIALRNLVRNAVQHRRPDLPLVVTLRAWRRHDTWTLTLADNGSGIPRGARARVFAPLQRAASAAGPGSGLGLTLARQAIEACGGSIAVASRGGAGTTFAVTLRVPAGDGARASRSARG